MNSENKTHPSADDKPFETEINERRQVISTMMKWVQHQYGGPNDPHREKYRDLDEHEVR